MIKNCIYKIDSIKVMSETLNNETIIINLENGNYYTLNETGTIIWENIQNNYSLEQIIKYFDNYYSDKYHTIEPTTLKLLEFLVNENIISESETNDSKIESDINSEIIKKDFITPLIEKYDDMQEMLLADPIHDVEEVGWPVFKANDK